MCICISCSTQTTHSPAQTQPDPDLCASSTQHDWKTCDGKHVRLQGHNPRQNISQHPMLAGPTIDPNQPKIVQTYIDLDSQTQLIVLTTQTTRCPGPFEVQGRLQRIKPQGDVGKSSYAGWAIYDATLTCLE